MAPLMRDPILTDAFYALDLFVAERLPNSSFVALTPPPRWLTRFLSSAAEGAPITIVQVFPFLAGFLTEAETFWREGTTRSMTSGPFAIDAAGGELLLRAWALNVGVNTLLVLARLQGEADTRPVLQKARDNALAHERLLRQVGATDAPLRELSRLAGELLAGDLTPAQRAVAENIGAAARRAQAALSREHLTQESPE
jgi:hypothetical protein